MRGRSRRPKGENQWTPPFELAGISGCVIDDRWPKHKVPGMLQTRWLTHHAPVVFSCHLPPPSASGWTPTEDVGGEKQQCSLEPEGVFQPPELTASAKGAGIPDGIMRPHRRWARETKHYRTIYVREVIRKWLPPRKKRRRGDDDSQRNGRYCELREDAAGHLSRSRRETSKASLPFVCAIPGSYQ